MWKRIVSGIVLALLIIGMSMFQGIERAFVDEARSGGLAFSSASATQYTPPNIIDHLPFIINETDVYYIIKDLTANGDGITILANNTVLIGQGHTLTGSGSGIGIDVNAIDVSINICNINNFKQAIYIRESGKANILYNILYNNGWGVYAKNNGNLIKGNVIIDNNYGIVISLGIGSTVYDNYFKNSANAILDYNNIWNTEKYSLTNIINGPYLGGNYWNDYVGQDTDGDGLGNTPYTIDSLNRDNLPLVDINPPRYSNIKGPPDSIPVSPDYTFNITWTDNVQVSNAILEFDGVNYTDPAKINESLGFSEYYGLWSSPVQDEVAYSKSFTNLSLGTHYYKWFANDTKNHWNSTELLSFTVTNISPSPIQIEVVPCNQVGDMKGSFQIGSMAYFKVTGNCTCQTQNLLLSINVFDNDSTTIGVSSFQGSIMHGLSTFIISVSIPTSAKIGNATVYANAYTDWPHKGGVPLCPEVSAIFQIIGS
jgi:parallel beta-helix repeat protein